MTAGRSAGRPAGRRAADLRRTSADAGAYRTHVGPYHPPSMKRSSMCMPTTLPLYLKWNNLLSFDREQLIFTYVVGRVQPPNISKDELNPSKKYILIL